MSEKGKCKFCGGPRQYEEGYDAFYCLQCDVWLEEKCDDPDCDFCKNRPDKPSMVPWIKKGDNNEC